MIVNSNGHCSLLSKELSQYTLVNGDPNTNGLGHTVTKGPAGVSLVLLGNNGIWEREESVIYQAVKTRKFDQGQDELAQRNIDERFLQIADGLDSAGSGNLGFEAQSIQAGGAPPAASPAREGIKDGGVGAGSPIVPPLNIAGSGSAAAITKRSLAGRNSRATLCLRRGAHGHAMQHDRP